jgi:hypothetical protein
VALGYSCQAEVDRMLSVRHWIRVSLPYPSHVDSG